MKIPFSPPRVDEETEKEVIDALRSGWITTGPKTMQFENELAEYIGTDHVVCLGSATAGLQLILNWLGIKEGDEVIVPAYTYCASANVIIHRGAKPVLVDVNADDFNISLESISKAITPRTKAIIAVDIAGLPADYDGIRKMVTSLGVMAQFTPSSEVQRKLGRIAIVADAAHSIGGISNSRQSGTLADITSFSFHAVKNLTTAEGGAVCFNLNGMFDHEELRKSFKTSSLHGQTKDALSKTQIGAWRYDVIEAGFKCNMTDLQAAIGLVELRRYNETLERRKQIFDAYTKELSKYEWATTPQYEDDSRTSSYHLYQLRIKGISEDQRNNIITAIGEYNVAVNVHYLPIPMLTFYKNLGYDISNYPQTYENYKCEISLPVFYNLKDEEVEYVLKAVVESVEAELKK